MTPATPDEATAVYLEVGLKRVFACALAWPGWCRSGKDESQALGALAAYAERYAPVAQEAGLRFPGSPSSTFDVVARLTGSVGYTDFGAPGSVATSDWDPLTGDEARRLAALVCAAWVVFDRIAAAAPPELRKGPRGGGRDRDKMIEHVLGAEVAYARKIGIKHRQPPLDDRQAIAALHDAIAGALQAADAATPQMPPGWPPRYAARRIAWHVLDHAWEMQDRGEPMR